MRISEASLATPLFFSFKKENIKKKEDKEKKKRTKGPSLKIQ